MANTISRTMKITKAQIEGFNREVQRAETKPVTLFTEPEGELEILAAVTSTQFIAFRASSIETKEEQREMTVADFYRKSRPVTKKEAKEATEEAAQ